MIARRALHPYSSAQCAFAVRRVRARLLHRGAHSLQHIDRSG
jgi:hypothetical protein